VSAARALRLGGALFRIHSPAGFALRPGLPTQRPFEVPVGTDGEPSMDVRLRIGPAPPVVGFRPRYDTGESWLCLATPGGWRLEHRHRRPTAEALWTADVGAGPADGADVYCGADLVDPERRLVRSPFHYPLDQLLLARILAGEGVIVHATGVRSRGYGVALPGVSGAGKSTSMRRLRGAADLEGLSDDRVVLRRRGEGFEVHGSPWAGDEKVASAARAPLAALGFLAKASADELRPVGPSEALSRLVPTASLLDWEGDLSAEAFAVCRAVTRAVPAFELRFRREGDVAGLVRALLDRSAKGSPGAP